MNLCSGSIANATERRRELEDIRFSPADGHIGLPFGVTVCRSFVRDFAKSGSEVGRFDHVLSTVCRSAANPANGIWWRKEGHDSKALPLSIAGWRSASYIAGLVFSLHLACALAQIHCLRLQFIAVY